MSHLQTMSGTPSPFALDNLPMPTRLLFSKRNGMHGTSGDNYLLPHSK